MIPEVDLYANLAIDPNDSIFLISNKIDPKIIERNSIQKLRINVDK